MIKLIRLIGRIAPYYLAISIPIFLILVANNLLFLRPIGGPDDTSITFLVPETQTRDQIANTLRASGLVRSSLALGFLLKREEKLQNKELSLSPGEYQLSPSLSPKDIAKSLWDLKKIDRLFTIKAGDTYKDIASSIAKAGLFPLEEILNAMTTRQLLIKLKLGAGIPEGYFIPGTYSFFKPIKAEEVVESLIRKGDENKLSKIPTFSQRSAALKLTPYDILILSSLIEKENLNEEEKKNFASLLHNRLLLDMPLESVPALNYGTNVLKGTNNALTESDKTTLGPYNTFIKARLPATPICSPSIDSIRAILYPNDTTYIYFRRTPNNTLSYYSDVKKFQSNIPG